MSYEKDYIRIINKIMTSGREAIGRNGMTKAVFGETLTIRNLEYDFPLLQGRKLFVDGVLGEFAAFIRGPEHIKDFEKFGCNYWSKWAKEDGSINVDYGNAWINYGGINQIADVVHSLNHDPYSRRHIISGWRPDNIDQLDLPCCHHLYQWFVKGDYLEMAWHQRSVDVMIGLPSDVILAAIFNICMAREVGLKPGTITMFLGDTHIYEEHFLSVTKYLKQYKKVGTPVTRYTFLGSNSPLTDIDDYKFTPNDITILDYTPADPIKFELVA